MKLSVVFLIVFAILLVAPQVAADRDSSMLPIPIINEAATASLVRANNMMVNAYEATVANEGFDKSGALTGIKLILEATNPVLDSFTTISGAVTSILIRHGGHVASPLTAFISAIVDAFTMAATFYANLEGKIKPSQLTDIVNAVAVIIGKIMNLSVFMPQVRSVALRDDLNQGLDLQMVNSEWSTAVDQCGKAVQSLAKAIQNIVNTRIQAINAQKSINKSLSMSGSYLSSISTQLNTALENARNQLGMFSQNTVMQISEGYYSITSNPSRWHESVISQIFGFIATYSGLIHNTYQTTIATAVKAVELAIAGAVIRQTRASSLTIADVSTTITDSAAASDNPRAAECANKQLAKLNYNSLNRLAQCITGESSNVAGIPNQGQQLLTVAKNNAVSSMSQLPTCNAGSDQCNQQLMIVFTNMVARATEDLTIAAGQVQTTLQALSDRIGNCLGAVNNDITATAVVITQDFNFCLAL